MNTRLSGVLVLIALLVCGCTPQRAFDNLKDYLGRTRPDGSLDAGALAAHWVPVVDRTDFGVPFLLKQSQSTDGPVAITANLVLDELVVQIKRNPTPNGEVIVRRIGPAAIVSRFAEFPTNNLASPWIGWYKMIHESMTKHLETRVGDDGNPPPQR